MTAILDTILQGVLLGGLYALFAAGLALIFGVMRLVNLAHGDLIVLAAYLILLLANALHLGVILSFLVALPLMFAVGYVLQAGTAQPRDRRRHIGAAADHFRPVDHPAERDADRLFRRQPPPDERRDRDGVAAAVQRPGDRRHAAADFPRRRRRHRRAQPALLSHRAWAAPFARFPTIPSRRG